MREGGREAGGRREGGGEGRKEDGIYLKREPTSRRLWWEKTLPILLGHPLPILPYHAQRPVLLEAGACDVPPHYQSTMPRGQSCWRLGLDEVPYYYLTMPRGQTCWRLGLVMYLTPYYQSTLPRGQSCWRLGLDEVPYYYLTMPRGQTCWRLGLVIPY